MSALVERYSELYMNKKRSKDREESVLEGILAGSGRRRNPNMARELHRAQRARRKVKYGSVASLIVLVALTTFMRIAAVFALKWNVLPRGISTAQESRNETGSWGVCKPLKTWWPGTELNRRRQPFQGCALPTELPGHVSKPALRAARIVRSARTGAGLQPNETAMPEAPGTPRL